ncbi:MAG TPA: hypothetical protein VJ861_05520 [Treponemataceae bacterium]|nr:hypothetical protein [Treponemataceae bacterium]
MDWEIKKEKAEVVGAKVVKDEFTDLAMGDAFVTHFEDRVRYCPAWKKWFVWDGGVYRYFIFVHICVVIQLKTVQI